VLTAAQLAADLIKDLCEIDGQDITIGGATALVTTERAIAEWITWHLHGDADGDTIACYCGWTPNQSMPTDEQMTALDAHADEAITAMRANIAARIEAEQ
jgi:hypothetical protein